MIKKIHIKDYDLELWEILKKEMIRQEEHIELIASENYVSSFIMEAQGSILTNKYAEGYPKNRFYNGCEFVDDIEKLAIERAKTLFGADYANVQPHSGSQANFSVYLSLLEIGDTVLSMKLSHGGHITHGASSNFSGKLYNFVFYGINKHGEIDYKSMKKLAKIHQPKMIVGGFSSYAGNVNWKKMREIADSINAYLFVDIAHVAGLVVSKLYPNPIDYAHVVTATTHKTLSGPRGGIILAKGGKVSFYDKLNHSVFPGTQGGPLMHVIAAKAIAFKEAMEPSFRNYQKKIIKNARIMSSIFIKRGFDIISGVTKNHLFLVNLSNKNVTGDQASKILSCANIIVNKNSIPNDVNNSSITTGIRIGTPAITRRGISIVDISLLSHWICDILNDIDNTQVIKDVKEKIRNICKKYPVYIK